MFHIPDTDTLRLCSVLSSTAFGLVFALVWLDRRDERHYAHWAASSILYAALLVGFGLAGGRPVPVGLLIGALAATNMLLISGLRCFDGRPPFRLWMLAPVAGCAAIHILPAWASGGDPHVLAWTRAADTIGIAATALTAGLAFLRRHDRENGRGGRIAGLAMLAYLPGYAVTLASGLWTVPRLDLLALIPMLSDQLLLGILNLGLLAMPAERAHARLRDAASRDPLTGVWNRAGFAAHARRLVEPGATVLVIDLDQFKAINDRNGHAAGDAVLIALARSVGAQVALLGGAFGRLGGDEFAAILPATRDPEAEGVIDRLHRACRGAQDGVPQWTASIGLSRIERGETGFGEAQQRADRELYQAKLAGRGRLAA